MFIYGEGGLRVLKQTVAVMLRPEGDLQEEDVFGLTVEMCGQFQHCWTFMYFVWLSVL